ncbi:MAG: alanine racemase, partial [Clostridia bacterium]|nr:alanine racemase [Clostridia bacterium]
VDVSDLPRARVGYTVALFGYDEGGTQVACEDYADQLGTISYELLCAINKRIPRIYLDGNRPSEILQYIV